MKVTHEDFLQRLSAKNPNIDVLEKYKGSKVNILCRCKGCGHTWLVRPSNLLSGKGCPTCAIKRNALRQTKTQDEFLAEISANNPDVVPLEPYAGVNKKILFCCKKCQYEWSARTSHVLNGHGCPVCGGSMRKGNDKFLSQLSKINPMIEPLEQYVNARTKIRCRCSYCKNEWYGTPDKLLQGQGCLFCDKRNKTSFPEQAIYYYLKKVYSDAANRFYLPDSKMEIDIFIPSQNVGIEYDGIFWHKRKAEHEAKKYQVCKDHGITLYRVRESTDKSEDIADSVFIRRKPYNFDTLDSVIRELFEKIKVDLDVCTFDDAAAIREQFFVEISINSLDVLYPEIAKEWHPEKNGATTPAMFSYGSNEKLWWKCSKCQHEWAATIVSRTTRTRGCPSCSRAKLSQKYKKKNEVFKEQLKEVNSNLETLEEYKTTHENILIRCKTCGHEWPAAPANLLRGKDCPICSRKRANAKISVTKKKYYSLMQESKG